MKIGIIIGIMLFYSLLSFFIFPAIGFFFLKSKKGLTYGMIIGFIVSIVLWIFFGQKMVTL